MNEQGKCFIIDTKNDTYFQSAKKCQVRVTSISSLQQLFYTLRKFEENKNEQEDDYYSEANIVFINRLDVIFGPVITTP